MTTRNPQRNEKGQPSNLGFTLVELLVVTMIIMILSGILLPVLTQAKQKAQGIKCMCNLRQMTFAWTLYAMDSEDKLLPNHPLKPERQWIKAYFRAGVKNNPDHTNTVHLKESYLSSYLEKTDVYKCLSDKTRNLHSRAGVDKSIPWVRSVGMNRWMGGIKNKLYNTFHRLSQIDRPADRMTFINQRADTLENGYYFNGSVGLFDPSRLRWYEFPAHYHNDSTTLAFADGHTENHQWKTDWPTLKEGYQGNKRTLTPNNPDVLWLNNRTTSLR
ncbi:MAG: type II secretion system protein [Verrucomicrobia bacterium]|nr:type II secretion system protein [Verrucomicrobiota bacterium]